MSRHIGIDWMASRPDHASNFTPLVAGAPDILSAASYTQLPPSAPLPTTSTILPLGVVLEQGELQNEVHSRPKKRSRASKIDSGDSNEASDETNKKQRGRPKVDNRDETAIDRRRTQIRLAQRAYRNRKESTITTLQQKVNNMQTRVLRMDKIFADLYSNLTNLEILDGRGQASRQLELLRQEFHQISNLISSEQDVDGEASNDSAIDKEQPVQAPQGHNSRGSNQSLDRSVRLLSTSSSDGNSLDGAANGVYKYAQMTSSGPPYHDFNTVPETNKAPSNIDRWAQQGLDLERSYPLRATYTYSFQETSFARRLHRLCIETAFRNIGDPSIDPAWISQTFHFALSYVDAVSLRTKFKELLQRGTGEPLESAETPFFHVGGAGTHFLRRDGSGKPMFPPNLLSPLQAPGPWKVLGDADDVSNDTIQELLGAIGYDGVWYDAREVEEYLKTKGIYLSGHESFVDIDPSKIGPPNAMCLPTVVDGRVTSPLTPLSSENMYSSNKSLDNVSKDACTDQDPMAFWSGMNTVTDHNSMCPDMMQACGQAPTPRSTIATLDIAKFLDRIIYGGACLGRAPGFRRAAVDQALALAVQESY